MLVLPDLHSNVCAPILMEKQVPLGGKLLSSSSLPATRSSPPLSLSLVLFFYIESYLLQEVCRALSHCVIFILVKMLDQKWGNHGQIYHLEDSVQNETARLLAQKAEEKNTVKK